MKMGSKLVLLLLTASLSLPLQAFAGNEVDKKKTAEAKPKPVIEAPANCRVKSKVYSAKANETRKDAVTERQLQGAVVTYNEDVAKKHGKKR